MVEMHEDFVQILNQYLRRSQVSKCMDPLS